MSAARARKEAAKRLGLALMQDYRALVEASGTDAVQTAAIKLGDTFNTNIEFIINVLKAYGGLDVSFEPLTRASPSLPPANDLPKMPEIFSAGASVDMLGKKPH